MLGSGKTRLRWTEGLRALGHFVEVVEPKEFEKWYGLKRAIRFRQAWGASALLKDKLTKGNYDLIEFFGGEFGLATWQLSKLPERPLIVAHTDGLELLANERERVYTLPNSIKRYLRAWYLKQTHERLSRAAFVYSDALVTGCNLDRQYVLRLGLYPPYLTAVVEPGLDKHILSRLFIGDKKNQVAFTGSWIIRKGITVLIKVMSKVLAKRSDVKFFLYGTGEQRETVRTYFPPELRSRIYVYPHLTNHEIAEGLAKAKVFFFPTQYEGFGMALAEAMACSCAAVTTRTGFGAALRDKQEALLCDFDDADAMEKSILALLQDEGLRRRIARRGWERVQGLEWEANVRKLESIYKQWTSNQGRFQKVNESDARSFKSAEIA